MTRCWYFDQVHVYFGFAPKNTPLSGDKVVLRPESGGEISLPADTDAGYNRLQFDDHCSTTSKDYHHLQTCLAVAIFYAFEQDLCVQVICVMPPRQV